MCEFVSWIAYNGKNYFLTNDCLRTKEGKKLKRYLGDYFKDDIKGHGAIRRYWGLKPNQGQNHECTKFSSPNNFPPEIVTAIITGNMSWISQAVPIGILCKPLDDDYKAKIKPLYDDYKAKCKLLDDDYKAKCKPLYDDYKAKRKLLDDDYKAKCKPLYDAQWKLVTKKNNRRKAWQ